ncbi:hypothetical protein K432DRAFT_394983 [Lepidopterella palustris CBS 459.81]|uniref:Uncharacterized protein n=1 Tax=Lepidopterella palustris CBS 459.81 TaxID=1314670 RepID=A0A8E2E6G9_9PEZI|nr:hypothetical protein K432DRAFT_394983 [Lepidopterella palustris CBS 459.81]
MWGNASVAQTVEMEERAESAKPVAVPISQLAVDADYGRGGLEDLGVADERPEGEDEDLGTDGDVWIASCHGCSRGRLHSSGKKTLSVKKYDYDLNVSSLPAERSAIFSHRIPRFERHDVQPAHMDEWPLEYNVTTMLGHKIAMEYMQKRLFQWSECVVEDKFNEERKPDDDCSDDIGRVLGT